MRIVRETVIEAALTLLDAVGIEGLTMRKLAEALNIQAPSLYWHFASKQVLVDAMADQLLADVARTEIAGEAWEARLRRLAGEVRRALLARRDGGRVFAGTYPVAENVLRSGDALIRCLADAGADMRTASWGAFSLMYFVIGFVIEEQAMAAGQGKDGNLADTDAYWQRYPLVAEAVAALAQGSQDERFAFGLDLQVDALAVRIAAGQPVA